MVGRRGITKFLFYILKGSHRSAVSHMVHVTNVKHHRERECLASHTTVSYITPGQHQLSREGLTYKKASHTPPIHRTLSLSQSKFPATWPASPHLPPSSIYIREVPTMPLCIAAAVVRPPSSSCQSCVDKRRRRAYGTSFPVGGLGQTVAHRTTAGDTIVRMVWRYGRVVCC